MLSKLWELLLGYLRGKAYWSVLQPFVILAVAFVGVELLTYQFLQAQYGFTPSLRLFLGSYLSFRTAIVFGGVALVLVLFKIPVRRAEHEMPGRVRSFLRANRGLIAFRVTVVVLVLGGILAGLAYVSPNKVSNIRIKFMDPPRDFDQDAFAYLVYELNRLQKNWYFEVDFEIFNPLALTSVQMDKCSEDPSPALCHTEEVAAGRPFIVLISNTLDQASDSLAHIKAELCKNPRLIEDFPEVCDTFGSSGGRRWTRDEIITANDIKITALGADKKIRGRRHGENRPTLIVLDDIENEAEVRSDDQRRGKAEWFNKAVLKAGNRLRTKAIVIGNGRSGPRNPERELSAQLIGPIQSVRLYGLDGLVPWNSSLPT